MFLGLLIGLALFGMTLAKANKDDTSKSSDVRRYRSNLRIFGVACFYLGACGAVGWIVEVVLFSHH
jgi:hypothetical protein